MIQTPFSLSWIKVLACFIRFEKCQIFQICVISLLLDVKSGSLLYLYCKCHSNSKQACLTLPGCITSFITFKK